MKHNNQKKNYIIVVEIICVMIGLVLFGFKIFIVNNLPDSYIGYSNICKVHRLVAINYISNLLCSLAIFLCTFIPFGSKALFLLKSEFKYKSSFSIVQAFETFVLLIIQTVISVFLAMTLYYSSYGNYFTERGNSPKEDKSLYHAISRDIKNDNTNIVDIDFEKNSISVDVRNLRDTFSSRQIVRSSSTRTIYKLNVVINNKSYSFVIGSNDYSSISDKINNDHYSAAKIEYYAESNLIKSIRFL
ncbi:MAG: hypothetical protein ACI4JW_00040 [Oscillospiraceae bacterium]